MTDKRTHIVRITYRDGKVMDTHPLTRDHAHSHCDTVIQYPSVVRAEVYESAREPKLADVK